MKMKMKWKWKPIIWHPQSSHPFFRFVHRTIFLMSPFQVSGAYWDLIDHKCDQLSCMLITTFLAVHAPCRGSPSVTETRLFSSILWRSSVTNFTFTHSLSLDHQVLSLLLSNVWSCCTAPTISLCFSLPSASFHSNWRIRTYGSSHRISR